MFNYRKVLGLVAMVCFITGLAGCGGGAGTDKKKVDLVVCTGTDVVLANGTCGPKPPLPACPEGQERETPTSACETVTTPMPTKPATLADDEVVIYINRASDKKEFGGYSLYTWQQCSGPFWLNASNPDSTGADNWNSETINPISSTPETADPIYGGYFIVKIRPDAPACGRFIVRTPGRAQQSSDLEIRLNPASKFNRRYFIIENPVTGLQNARTSAVPICVNDICKAYEAPALAISDVSAHWIDPTTILWNRSVSNVQLYAAKDGEKITAAQDGSVAGGTLVASLTAGAITDEQRAKVPNLGSFHAYSLNLSNDVIKGLLKKELVIVGVTDAGEKIGTRIQNYALLDALYTSGEHDANEANLGVNYSGDNVTLSVWAPTAQLVELRLFSDTPTPTVDGVPGNFPSLSTKNMTFDSATGIWSYTGTKTELDRKFYRYRVTGYNQITNKTHVLEVPDPHAVSLSANGFHSQIVNLNDADLKPAGWDAQEVPTVTSPESMAIYELHVRDFSALDQSTPAAHRGKYLAFTDMDSAPVKHLKELQAAGLTHVHLLPTNDGSSIREGSQKQYNLDSLVREFCVASPRASVCADPGNPVNTNANNNATLREVLQSYAGDSDKARKLMDSLSSFDGFNWNYDPQFFNAPEGSYATKADGATRVLEMRAMNMALHQMGLRVVMDVVYPHMSSSGVEAANSTFDKIVPGYYFRQNAISGTVINETGAGPDTATEHVMMGKFMSDSVTQWAAQYKVDGFRFDQAGFLPKAALTAAYDAVKAVDPDTYFYAEAWTAGNDSAARIAQRASQIPLAGTGIGTFNDRMRNPLRQLALVNGGDLDAVRAGLAGNLSEFKLKAKSGKTIKASLVGAYNLDPQEAINYVDVHDDAALWDWMHNPGALPANTSIENRVRIQDLTLSVPALSQGVPFFLAGSEMLRSKSMTFNSYNAGDWFNFIDFTMQTNNWRVGLPVESNATRDADALAAFADAQSKPTPLLIKKSSDVFNEFLKIAKSSPLFSLTTADQVFDRVGFHDGDTTQKPNLIVMSIDDGAGKVVGGTENRADLDPNVDAVVVIFNGSSSSVTQKILTSTGFELHSVQKNSVDDVVRTASFAEGDGGGSFTVPAYTTAVFVKPQSGAQGAGLSSTATSGYEPPVPYGDTDIYVRGQVSSAGWDATSVNKMKYEGKGIYSAYLTIPGGAAIFKIAEANWSQPNLGGGQEVVLNTPVTLVQGSNANLSTNLPAGEYKFVLNALQSTTAPVLTVTKADVYGDSPLYARGGITSLGWDTASNTVNLMAYIGMSQYDLVAPTVLGAGSYEFKFGAANWSHEAGAGSDGQAIVIGTPKALVRTGGSNISLAVTDAGAYSIRLNSADPSAPIATVYKDDVYNAIPLYLRGTIALGWGFGDENKLTYVGHGLYTKTFTITASATPYEFKVADKDWTGPTIFGPGNTTLGSGLSDVHTNIGITISVTGDYKFTFDTATTPRTITVTKVN